MHEARAMVPTVFKVVRILAIANILVEAVLLQCPHVFRVRQGLIGSNRAPIGS